MNTCLSLQCRLPCERQLSHEAQEIPQRSSQVLHPLWSTSLDFRDMSRLDIPGNVWRLHLLDPQRQKQLASLFIFPPLHIDSMGLPPDPAGNTVLFEMPAVWGEHKIWEACQCGSLLYPQLSHLHSLSWSQASQVVPKLASSEGRPMKPVNLQFPQALMGCIPYLSRWEIP